MALRHPSPSPSLLHHLADVAGSAVVLTGFMTAALALATVLFTAGL